MHHYDPTCELTSDLGQFAVSTRRFVKACACPCTHTHTHTHTRISTKTHVHAHMHTHPHPLTYTYTHTKTHAYTRVVKRARTHTQVRTCIQTGRQTHRDTLTHTYIRDLKPSHARSVRLTHFNHFSRSYATPCISHTEKEGIACPAISERKYVDSCLELYRVKNIYKAARTHFSIYILYRSFFQNSAVPS